MEGTIPSQLGLLTDMEYGFFVDTNFLTGTIPTEMGRHTNNTLASHFHNNLLTGTIPTQLGELTALTDLGFGAYGLSLWGNYLTGESGPPFGLPHYMRLLWEVSQVFSLSRFHSNRTWEAHRCLQVGSK